MSRKRKGIRKEWELRKLLLSSGFLVIRSSASRTGVDILASNYKQVIAFQVQSSRYLSMDKVRELEKYARAFNAVPVIAVKERRKWIFNSVEELEECGKEAKVVEGTETDIAMKRLLGLR
jgi:Holliday junction resolvase